MSNLPGQPKLVAQVLIQMFDNGQVSCRVESEDQLAVFSALGMAIQNLSAEYMKQRARQIQVAPAGLLAQLPN